MHFKAERSIPICKMLKILYILWHDSNRRYSVQEADLMTTKQGDQIGRIFAQWAIFGCILKIPQVTQILVLLFPKKRLCNNVGKTWFGRFFHKLIWPPCH
jgi:hypothetical protein